MSEKFGNSGGEITSTEYMTAPSVQPQTQQDTEVHWMFIIVASCIITALLVIIAFLLCLYCSLRRKKRFRRRSSLHQSCQMPYPGYCMRCSAQPGNIIHCGNLRQGVYAHCDSHWNSNNFPHVPNYSETDHMRQLQADALHGNFELREHTQTQRDNNSDTNGIDSEHSFSYRSVPLNPLFRDSAECSTVDETSEHVFDSLEQLYKVTNRSITQTVCGKLLVSIARKVGHCGDVLILDNMGITLKVPEGAVKRGETKLIVLVLNWDLSDNPLMNDMESLVSPVVYVGPHGLKLEKPCTLSFKHCSFNPNQIKIMRSETELTDQKDWKVAKVASEEPKNTDSFNLTPDECQLQIDTFTLYTCVQTPLNNIVGKKWLQVAVFACPLRARAEHHQIRVYFLNKTNCALQWAIQNEAQFGGKLVCPEKVFLFDGNELDMFTQTKYISDGWELIDKTNTEKISFLNIWHGHCPHISVCFRRVRESEQPRDSVAIEMTLHLFTFQTTLEENGEKIFIQLFEDDKSPLNENEIKRMCNHHVDIHINNFVGGGDIRPLDGAQSAGRQRSTFSVSSTTSDAKLEQRLSSECSHAIPRQNSSHSFSSQAVESDVNNSENVTYQSTPLANVNADGTKRSMYSVSCNEQSQKLPPSASKNAMISRTYPSCDKDLNIVINNNYSCSVAETQTRDTICWETLSEMKRPLCHSLRKRLQLFLDPLTGPYGHDWRDLASKLELDACIPKLQSKDSPTEELLAVIEERGMSLEDLKRLFEEIGRQDCACEVEKYVKGDDFTDCSREATEHSELNTKLITKKAQEHDFCSELFTAKK